MADATKKAVSLVDSLRWSDAGVVHEEEDAKGKTFELPAKEFDRLERGGSVAAPRSDEAKAAKDAADEEPPAAEA